MLDNAVMFFDPGQGLPTGTILMRAGTLNNDAPLAFKIKRSTCREHDFVETDTDT